MLASLLIVFREVLEAGLIVGIVLAATEGVIGRVRWIGAGILSGLLGAGIVAGFAGVISQALEGMGQEIFTVFILLIAVTMLSWHTLWMASHGRQISRDMKALGSAVKLGDRTLFSLAVVITLAILREGSEVVLFLYGIARSTTEGPMAMLAGGVGGLASGILSAWLLYRGLLAIPARHLFSVTNGLVMLLAAGMAGQAAAILASIDLLPSLGNRIWNSAAFLPENSIPGKALHALIGYSEQPSGIQIAAWLVTLGSLMILSRFIGRGEAGTLTPVNS